MADYGAPVGYQELSLDVKRNRIGDADEATRRKMLAAAMRGTPAPKAATGGGGMAAPSRHRELTHGGKTYDEIVTAAERGQ